MLPLSRLLNIAESGKVSVEVDLQSYTCRALHAEFTDDCLVELKAYKTIIIRKAIVDMQYGRRIVNSTCRRSTLNLWTISAFQG